MKGNGEAASLAFLDHDAVERHALEPRLVRENGLLGGHGPLAGISLGREEARPVERLRAQASERRREGGLVLAEGALLLPEQEEPADQLAAHHEGKADRGAPEVGETGLGSRRRQLGHLLHVNGLTAPEHVEEQRRDVEREPIPTVHELQR